MKEPSASPDKKKYRCDMMALFSCMSRQGRAHKFHGSTKLLCHLLLTALYFFTHIWCWLLGYLRILNAMFTVHTIRR